MDYNQFSIGTALYYPGITGDAQNVKLFKGAYSNV
jgi:hypothetical protein